ncbi:hypothetical protein B0I08_101154 [Glaciihabitans tibetensis]|uniref:Uncharacterized protein n=1 Tax=Glaciihabitans tibetensis TaxID=1266600 RepID=A0A2T0VII9_9MICO|nr:hypothetical protein [Glaciihabitans tibetensis]PRY70032.1 hypothetical protein B0I08_101154 [Glaciihabitans tibetensis]
MSDTTGPRNESAAPSAKPLNDSAEMRDAMRSIEAIGEDRTGTDTDLDTDTDTDTDTDVDTDVDVDTDEDGS